MLHIIHSNESATCCKFDILPVFIFVKTRGVGQNFNQIFYSFLHENDTQFFTTEDKFKARKKDKIVYIIKKKKKKKKKKKV